jgi:hypothetical protein
VVPAHHQGVEDPSVRTRDGGASGSRVGLVDLRLLPREERGVYVYMQYYKIHAVLCGVWMPIMVQYHTVRLSLTA